MKKIVIPVIAVLLLFFSFSQNKNETDLADFRISVRIRVIRAIRDALRAVSPSTPLGSVDTWGNRVRSRTAVPRLLMSLGRRYVQYINRSYHRTGSLWEGRFKSSLVQVEEYLLTCIRYIELNPVRANRVNDPAQYRWSSYRQNGLGQADERITSHPLYLSLERRGRSAC